MNKSQLQDLGIVNEQLGLMQQEASLLRTTLVSCETRARNLEEEIASLSKIKTRERYCGILTGGLGIVCLAAGLIPFSINHDVQNWQKVCIGIGATATAAGVATFVFTFNF